MTRTAIHRFLLFGLIMAAPPVLCAQDQGNLTQYAEHLKEAAANDTYPTFSLTLSSKAPEYHIGSIMWAKIAVTNLTNHDIDCTEEWGGIDFTFEYEAADEDGKPVARRFQKEHSAGFDVHPAGIGAGGSTAREFQLERAFKFDRPGKYKIRVSRREPFLMDENGDNKVVYSNWITITVTG